MSNQPTLQTLLETVTSESYDEPVTPPDCWGLLVPISSGQPGRAIFLTKRLSSPANEYKFKIGRSTTNDLVLSEPNIGSVHCTLSLMLSWHGDGKPNNEDTYVFVRDDSSNGTYINRKLVGRGCTVRLEVGGELSFGSYRYRFRLPYSSTKDDGVLAEYALGAPLGKGTFGTVHYALHRSTGQLFACKIISKNRFAGDLKMLEMAQREITILGALDHPHICKLIEHLQDESTIWLILELVGGGDLNAAVAQKGCFSESEARRLMAEICQAMEYSHSRGVVHRDLKPENILLTGTIPEHVKVADFGLAKDIGGDSLLQTFCGTPVYLAPEIVSGKGVKAYTPRVDSWSIGVVAWVLLTGAVPFDNDGGPALTRFERQAINWSHLSSLGLSNECVDWIQRMLAFDPTQRMTIQGALGHPWLAVEHGSEVNEVAPVSSSAWTLLGAAPATQGATVVPALLVPSNSNSVGSSSTQVPQGEENPGGLPVVAAPTPVSGQAHAQQAASFWGLPGTGKIERRWGRRFRPTGGNALRKRNTVA